MDEESFLIPPGNAGVAASASVIGTVFELVFRQQ